MKNMNKQSGFVIEGAMILALALGVGLFSGLMTEHKAQHAEAHHQQQQIDNIKSGGVNDGKVDW